MRIPSADLDHVVPRPKGKLKDFTFALTIEQAAEFLDLQVAALRELLDRKKCLHRDITLDIERPDATSEWSSPGRAAICWCNNRQLVSTTLRLKSGLPGPEIRPPCISLQQLDIPSATGEYLFSRDHLVDVVGEKLGLLQRSNVDQSWKSVPTHGLVVISGATNCFKSQLSTGLVLKYLLQLDKSKAFHHLVTFEDPIEGWEFVASTQPGLTPPIEKTLLSPDIATKYGLWFTPRCKGHDNDVKKLSDAVNDALRQTPSCFYIGEIRVDADWKQALKLASTGHLVVATTHASSLCETFTRIFSAVKADHEESRAIVVNSLLGVVHMKSLRIDPLQGAAPLLPQTFPAVWRRTTESTATLISDGIAAIIPDGHNVLGRRTIASLLFKKTRPQTPAAGSPKSRGSAIPLPIEPNALSACAIDDVLIS